MQRLTTSAARRVFGELVNRAYYGKESAIITRRGKDLAAIVPMSVLQPESEITIPPKKAPRRAK